MKAFMLSLLIAVGLVLWIAPRVEGAGCPGGQTTSRFIRGDFDEDGDVDVDDYSGLYDWIAYGTGTPPTNCDAMDVDDDGDIDGSDQTALYGYVYTTQDPWNIAAPNMATGAGYDPTIDNLNRACDERTSYTAASFSSGTIDRRSVSGKTAWDNYYENESGGDDIYAVLDNSGSCGTQTEAENYLDFTWTVSNGEPFTYERTLGENAEEIKPWGINFKADYAFYTYQGVNVCSGACNATPRESRLWVDLSSAYVKIKLKNVRTSTESIWWGYEYISPTTYADNGVQSSDVGGFPCECSSPQFKGKSVQTGDCVTDQTIEKTGTLDIYWSPSQVRGIIATMSKVAGDEFVLSKVCIYGAKLRYSSPTQSVFDEQAIEMDITPVSESVDIDVGALMFLRGDVDGNGVVNSTDSSYLTSLLASSSGYYWPPNIDACDADDDGDVDAADATYITNHYATPGDFTVPNTVLGPGFDETDEIILHDVIKGYIPPPHSGSSVTTRGKNKGLKKQTYGPNLIITDGSATKNSCDNNDSWPLPNPFASSTNTDMRTESFRLESNQGCDTTDLCNTVDVSFTIDGNSAITPRLTYGDLKSIVANSTPGWSDTIEYFLLGHIILENYCDCDPYTTTLDEIDFNLTPSSTIKQMWKNLTNNEMYVVTSNAPELMPINHTSAQVTHSGSDCNCGTTAGSIKGFSDECSYDSCVISKVDNNCGMFVQDDHSAAELLAAVEFDGLPLDTDVIKLYSVSIDGIEVLHKTLLGENIDIEYIDVSVAMTGTAIKIPRQ